MIGGRCLRYKNSKIYKWFINMDVLQTKNRIEYLDAMRGFCMILVVYAHLGLSAMWRICFETMCFTPSECRCLFLEWLFMLFKIGKRTLPIYLTHYFLLSGVALGIIVPVIQNNCDWIVGFMCFFILSLVILGTCLLIEALFRKAGPLYRLCFGYPNWRYFFSFICSI